MDSLPIIIRFNLRIFQLLGYFPVSLQTQQSKSIIGTIRVLWSLIPLFLFTTITMVVFFSDEEFRFTGDAFGYFNDTLKICLAQLSVTCYFLESLLRRKYQRQFWIYYFILQKGKFLEKFDSLFKRLRQELKQNIQYLSVVCGISTLEICLMTTFVILQVKSYHLVLYWSMFTPFAWFVHLRNMQIILHVDLIRRELLQLRLDLALIADYTKFITRVRPFKGFEEFLRQKLLNKQKTYDNIFEMYECFQKTFGYSIMFTMLMIYIRILVDVYFTYYSLYFGRNQFETLLIIPSLFEIPSYLLLSKKCMDVIKFITFEIHSIIRPLNDMRLSIQIQNFSLQVLHQKIVINGIGIATMDGYLLAKIVGSITMYMLFFIQFMPNFVAHSN